MAVGAIVSLIIIGFAMYDVFITVIIIYIIVI